MSLLSSTPLNWHSTLRRLKKDPAYGGLGALGRQMGVIPGGGKALLHNAVLGVVTKHRPTTVLQNAAKDLEKVVEKPHKPNKKLKSEIKKASAAGDVDEVVAAKEAPNAPQFGVTAQLRDASPRTPAGRPSSSPEAPAPEPEQPAQPEPPAQPVSPAPLATPATPKRLFGAQEIQEGIPKLPKGVTPSENVLEAARAIKTPADVKRFTRNPNVVQYAKQSRFTEIGMALALVAKALGEGALRAIYETSSVKAATASLLGGEGVSKKPNAGAQGARSAAAEAQVAADKARKQSEEIEAANAKAAAERSQQPIARSTAPPRERPPPAAMEGGGGGGGGIQPPKSYDEFKRKQLKGLQKLVAEFPNAHPGNAETYNSPLKLKAHLKVFFKV
jgi:hypothetical protein